MGDTGACSKRVVGVQLSALHLTHPGGLIFLSGSGTQPWLLVSPAYNHLPLCLPKINPLESLCAQGTKSRFIVLPRPLPRYLIKICCSPARRRASSSRGKNPTPNVSPDNQPFVLFVFCYRQNKTCQSVKNISERGLASLPCLIHGNVLSVAARTVKHFDTQCAHYKNEVSYQKWL